MSASIEAMKMTVETLMSDTVPRIRADIIQLEKTRDGINAKIKRQVKLLVLVQDEIDRLGRTIKLRTGK